MINKILAATGVMIFVFGGWAGLRLWQAGEFVEIDHSILSHLSNDKEPNHDNYVVLQAGPTAPTLSFDLVPDTLDGWNLHILSGNFRFSPEALDQPNVEGEGHAHVFVNGKKLARVYGPWFHIPALPAGQITVEVTLNSNMHNPLSVGDKPLMFIKKFFVQ